MRSLPRKALRRALATALCLVVAMGLLQAAPVVLCASTVARADDTSVITVRYHATRQVGNLWLQPSLNSPTAFIQCGNLTAGREGDSSLTETALPALIKGCTAALEAADLTAYKATFSDRADLYAAISTNPSDYYFAGWYDTFNSYTKRPRLVSSTTTISPEQVLSAAADLANPSDTLDLYAIYLPKNQTSTLTFPQGETYAFDPFTQKLTNTTAADGDVLATVTSPDFQNLKALRFGVTASSGGYETTSFSGPSVTRAQAEAFLSEIGGPGYAHLMGDGKLALQPQYAYNQLNVTFHSGVTASDEGLSQTFTATSATTEANGLTGLKTLASLQADPIVGTAFATPKDSSNNPMAFDGWVLSTTALSSIPKTSVAASAAGMLTASDATSKSVLNASYKTAAQSTYLLYPIWIGQGLGWKEETAGVRYYDDVSGTPTYVTGTQTIAGSTYYFGSDGVMRTGWQGSGTNTRYFDPAEGESPTGGGAMVHDALRTVSGKTYYFKTDGTMAVDEAVTAGGKTYYFGADGNRATGWQGPANDRRYFNPENSGVMVASQLFTIEDDGTYYFMGDGRSVKGQLYTAGQSTYLLDAEGHALSGWQSVSGKSYYFDPTTFKMANDGLTDIGDDTYYFRADGSHAVSEIVTMAGGARSYFDASGKLVRNATVRVGEREYTADENGILHTNYHDYSSGFMIGRDNNSFTNANATSADGFFDHDSYALSDALYRRLTRDADLRDSAFVESYLHRGWVSAAYGIAASQALLFEGKMGMSVLTASGANSYFTMPSPSKEARLADTLNYFTLTQLMVGYGSRDLATSHHSVYSAYSEFAQAGVSLERFLMDLVENPDNDKLRLLGYLVGSYGSYVIVTGVTFRDGSSTYDVELYDPNSTTTSKASTLSHLTVSADFRRFSFTDAAGHAVDEDNVKELFFISPQKLAPLVPSGMGVAALAGLAASALPDGHALISLPLDVPFTLENAAGKKLEGDGSSLSGDMAVYDMNMVAAGEDTVFVLEVDSSSFEIATQDGVVDLSARSKDGFAAVRATGATSAELDYFAGSVKLEGRDSRFEASVLTAAEDGHGLASVSGIAKTGVSVTRVGRSGVNVRTTGELTDVTARRYVDATVVEKRFADGSSFSFDVEDDFRVPETPATPSTAETPATPATPVDPSKNGWQFEEGSWRHYENGVAQTGWLWCDDAWGKAWYYLGSDGVMCTGWVYTGGVWYWMHPSGKMATRWIYDGLNWYYLNGSGVMQRSWQWIDGHWYWLGDSGAMATGWQWIAEAWYWMDASGAMASDTWVDGYYLARDGRWVRDA